jgi:hypothetical protein
VFVSNIQKLCKVIVKGFCGLEWKSTWKSEPLAVRKV